MENSCKTDKKPASFKELIRSKYFWKPFAGVSIGIVAGFLYYYFAGCKSGSCAITGNPYASMLWGGAMGFFVTNSPCSRC